VSTFSANIGLARLLNERNISGEVKIDHNWYGIATALYTQRTVHVCEKKMDCNGVDGLLAKAKKLNI
jgi:hypothetical protein